MVSDLEVSSHLFADELFPGTVVSTADPDVVFAAPVSVADAAVPQVCVDTPAPFDVSVPSFVVGFGGDSSGRPKFFAPPNVDHCAMSSSSFEVVG